MSLQPPSPPLPWLEPGDPFPPVTSAWGVQDPAPGLLAAGGVLDVPTLTSAYAQGIFPWFSQGQPVLWWSTDPRMVLRCSELKLHRSLRKTTRRLLREQRLVIRFDHAFDAVIQACAHTRRPQQSGTWIVPAMAQAYGMLHRAGFAHSVEAWIDGELAGGLYVVNLGRMVFGESMFSRVSDASKMALLALVAFCRASEIAWIDCQQETAHLASLGARAMPREVFCQHLASVTQLAPPRWQFEPLYWEHVLPANGERL